MEQIYFFDDNNKETTKEKATKYIIRECDENGKLISETRGIMNKKDSLFEITQEEYDYLVSIGKKPEENTYVIKEQ